MENLENGETGEWENWGTIVSEFPSANDTISVDR